MSLQIVHLKQQCLGKVFLMMPSGGCRKLNFWTSRPNPDKNRIFGILTLRAFNWYIYVSNRRGGGWGGGQVFFFFGPGGGGGGGGARPSFSDPPSRIFLGHFLEILKRNLQLKPSRLAPFLCEMGKKGGLCARLQVRATRAWVWAAGCVKPKEQLISPNLQDSINTRCTLEC